MVLSPNIKDVKQTAELTRPSLWQRIPSWVKNGAAVLGVVSALGIGANAIYQREADYTASLARGADALVGDVKFPVEQALVNRADSLKHQVNAIYLSGARDMNPATWFQSGRNLRHASLVLGSIPHTGYPYH